MTFEGRFQVGFQVGFQVRFQVCFQVRFQNTEIALTFGIFSYDNADTLKRKDWSWQILWDNFESETTFSCLTNGTKPKL